MPFIERSTAVIALTVVCACSPLQPSQSSSKQSERSCEGCHTEIAREQSASFHRAAFTDVTFQRSLALEAPEERAFCTGCHAPEKDVAVGVGCISCHRSANAPHVSAQSNRKAPHAVTIDPTFATPSACRSCHEFVFDPARDGRPDLVQKTLAEHASSPFAGVSCIECHMKSVTNAKNEGGRHLDHSFAAGHSPDWLRKSVHVDARRSQSGARITIRSDAGHAFPTGDMFRRVRLLVFGEAVDGSIVASEERTYGRTWGKMKSGPHAGQRRELSDTRIRGEIVEDLDLGDSTSINRIRYVVLFERILSMPNGEDPSNVSLESSDVLADGYAL